MAAIGHLSHYGLEKVGETPDNIIFSGTLAACRGMAFAHGLEIVRTEGRILSINGRSTTTNETDVVRYVLTQGMIQRCRDGWSLVMPLAVWNTN